MGMKRSESDSEDPNPDSFVQPGAEPLFRALRFTRWPVVKPFWEDLNRSWKGGELALDYRAHEIIWERFLEPRGFELQIYVVLEGDRCIAIFPMSRSERDPFGSTCWSLSDDFIIAREYFCPEDQIHRAIELIPPHITDDMSCFYRPADTTGFDQGPGGVVDLKDSREAYLGSLRGSDRRDLLHTIRKNADILVETDNRVRGDEIAPLLERYLRYRKRKCGESRAEYFKYSRDKILCDLALMQRAEEMSRLVALYFRWGEELVAANYSVLRESDRVDDYLCIRTDEEAHAKRGLGIFAILANMDVCRGLGVRFYDMSASGAAYKAKFSNFSKTFFYRRYDVGGAGEPFPTEL